MEHNSYSVLMSIYEKEKPAFLFSSIMSMLNQTIKPDEIVLVKDGPLTDELEDVIDNFLKDYPHIFTIVVNEINLGLGKALYKGLLRCRNELVARMDTDDVARYNRIEKQLEFFRNNMNLSMVGGQISEFVDNPENSIGKRIVPTKDYEIKKYMQKRCPFNHMTVMFKKSDVIKSGNYIDLHYNEDYYLWVRMMQNQCEFANVDEVLVDVRVDANLYKRRGGKKYFDSELFVQKYMLENKMISLPLFLYNVLIRFILQVLLPNNVRQFIFKNFARKKND